MAAAVRTEQGSRNGEGHGIPVGSQGASNERPPLQCRPVRPHPRVKAPMLNLVCIQFARRCSGWRRRMGPLALLISVALSSHAAFAVSVSRSGLGQVLLYPYYTARASGPNG